MQCYSCEGRDNDLCVTNPARGANTVDCRSGQCSIVRTERSDSSGKRSISAAVVSTFSVSRVQQFICTQTGTRVTIVRDCRSGSVATSSSNNGGSSSFAHSCSTDLCNSGDGRVFNSFPGFNVNYGGASGFGNAGPVAAPGTRDIRSSLQRIFK